MTLRRIIHRTYDPETGIPLKTYFTQNPMPEGTVFEISYGGCIFTFRIEQHFVSDETLSVIKFLGEKT
jgi:hypothetical protein